MLINLDDNNNLPFKNQIIYTIGVRGLEELIEEKFETEFDYQENGANDYESFAEEEQEKVFMTYSDNYHFLLIDGKTFSNAERQSMITDYLFDPDEYSDYIIVFLDDLVCRKVIKPGIYCVKL
jgi:hypothetical protein